MELSLRQRLHYILTTRRLITQQYRVPLVQVFVAKLYEPTGVDDVFVYVLYVKKIKYKYQP